MNSSRRLALRIVRLGNGIEMVAYLLGGTAVTIFFVAIFLNVLCREIFTPLMWAEEVSRFGYIWAIFLGAGVAMRHAKHFTIDIVVGMISGRAKLALEVFKSVVILVFVCVLFYYGAQFAAMSVQRISFPSGITLIYSTLAIPVGAVFLIYFMLEQLVLLGAGMSLREAEEALGQGGAP